MNPVLIFVSLTMLMGFARNKAIGQTNANKEASQYCFSKLTANEQLETYSRILNMGASFTHGCPACDTISTWQQYNAMTDDSHAIRRNYMTYFLTSPLWKTEQSVDRILVFENDIKTRFNSISQNQLQNKGYLGAWQYEPKRDLVMLTAHQDLQKDLASVPGFYENVTLLGGVSVQKNLQPRRTRSHGVLYQTAPKSGSPLAAFDVSLDGADSQGYFQAYGKASVYNKLLKGDWNDSVAREQLVDQVAKHMLAFRPSVAFMIDSFFWDTFRHSLSILSQKNPSSQLAKTLFAISKGADIFKPIYNDEIRFRIRQDMFRLITAISKGNNGVRIPVFVGRLLDDPIRTMGQQNLHPIVAAIAGRAVASVTGSNITPNLSLWLKSAKTAFRQVASEQSQNEFNGFADTGFVTGRPKLLPIVADGTANLAILSMVRDLPLLLESFEEAALKMNQDLRDFANQPGDSVYLINIDTFYQNFPSYLKPEMLHPSVFGANKMSQLIDESVCRSEGPQ